MTDLIQIQLITSSLIITIFALALRFGLFGKVFRGLDLEEGFPAFRIIIIAIMAYLTFLIAKDIWKVVR
jgi:hypothetical protein